MTTTYETVAAEVAAAREEARLCLEADNYMAVADGAAADLRDAFESYLRAAAVAWGAYVRSNQSFAFPSEIACAFVGAPASLRALIQRAVIAGEDLVPLLPEQG